jgi:GntR family transcriptional regulator
MARVVTINAVPTQSVRRTRDDLADQVYRQLKEIIVIGILRPGEPFPTVASLAQRYSLATKTVHTATAALRAEGLIVPAQAAGTSEGMLVAEPSREAMMDVGEMYLVDVLERIFRLGCSKDEVLEVCRRLITRWYTERQGERRMLAASIDAGDDRRGDPDRRRPRIRRARASS